MMFASYFDGPSFFPNQVLVNKVIGRTIEAVDHLTNQLMSCVSSFHPVLTVSTFPSDDLKQSHDKVNLKLK